MGDIGDGAALAHHASAFESMNAAASPMPAATTSQSFSLNAFSPFGDDPALWGQQTDFSSAGFPPESQHLWRWPHQLGQPPGSFDVRDGLTTPPKDTFSDSVTSDGYFDRADGVDPNDMVAQGKGAAKKRSRTGGEVDGGNAGGRKARRNSKIARESEELQGIDDEDKREKFLERNRVAASKCRQKKKVWTSNLEQRARKLTSERQMLTTHVAMLRNELLELKCRCLEHTNCECGQIREYLKNTVAALQPASADLYQFVEGSSRNSSSTSDSNNLISPSPMPSSRRSSVSRDSTLDYLKIEDDLHTLLSHSLHDQTGGPKQEN